MGQIFLILAQVLNLLMVLLFIRIIMSWVQPYPDYSRQPLKILYDITEPIMGPFRRLIPPLGGIDFSPMILFIVIQILQWWLKTLAFQFGA